MMGFDLDKTVHAITAPFTAALDDFDEQMSLVVKELQTTNKLLKLACTKLEEITGQNHRLGCMVERELKYVNQGVRDAHKVQAKDS